MVCRVARLLKLSAEVILTQLTADWCTRNAQYAAEVSLNQHTDAIPAEVGRQMARGCPDSAFPTECNGARACSDSAPT